MFRQAQNRVRIYSIKIQKNFLPSRKGREGKLLLCVHEQTCAFYHGLYNQPKLSIRFGAVVIIHIQ